ncbi:MAG: nucleotide pyrophosphohydrolase [Gemmatimonadales bacterium]
MTSPTDKLERLAADVRDFVRERDWEQFHDPKNLSMAIASEAGELLAEFRWVRSQDADRVAEDPVARERVEDEIADIAISLVALSNRLQLDLFDVVQRKLSRNRENYPVEASRGKAERRRTGEPI